MKKIKKAKKIHIKFYIIIAVFVLGAIQGLVNKAYSLGAKAVDKAKPQALVSGGKTRYPYVLKRDPFQTFLYTKKPLVSFKAGELPLLQYGISSLKVVGIMNRRGKYFGMIQTPDGRSYIITVGSLVGVNRARVVSMNANEINLVERTYSILGRMHTINVVMPLK